MEYSTVIGVIFGTCIFSLIVFSLGYMIGNVKGLREMRKKIFSEELSMFISKIKPLISELERSQREPIGINDVHPKRIILEEVAKASYSDIQNALNLCNMFEDISVDR